MSFQVTANEVGVVGQTALTRAHQLNSRSMEQLTSGRRINSAADDAAGLGVSSNLEDQHRGQRMAMRNIADGISMLTTAEGAASTVGDIITRMRELAVQSSSEVLGNTERAYLQDEFAQLETEIGDIAARTVFNTTNLADGSTLSLDVQVGANNSGADRVTINFVDLTVSTILGGTHDISSATGAQDSLVDLDTGLTRVSQARSTLGAGMNRLNSVIQSSERYSHSMVSAESKIADADYARETAEMAKAQIMMQSNIAGRAQARTSAQSVLSLIG